MPLGNTSRKVLIRLARDTDEAELARIDLATWTPATTPAPPPDDPDGYLFFNERTSPSDVIVAEQHGRAVGYVKLGAWTLASRSHVLDVAGLAVDPRAQGAGIGRRLMAAAVDEAARRGARKLTLRVLAPNATARKVYTECGFVIEGVLTGEFLLDGQLVDDVIMARHLETRPPPQD